MKRALTIAGSDSGGGAGVQADLRVFNALGVYGLSALTAITAQNSYEVRAVWPVPTEAVRAQIQAVVEDFGVDAVKIGMWPEPWPVDFACPVVFDPVMRASSGFTLASADLRPLFSRITLLTPNLHEAQILSGVKIRTREDMVRAACRLAAEGCANVLVKGGHLPGVECADLLWTDREHWLSAKRVPTPHTHGSGCTLSSAITAHLALGFSLLDSVRQAKEFVTRALERARPMGHGPGAAFYPRS